MQDTLENHQSVISIIGRYISSLRFADHIDLLAFSDSGLQGLTYSLEKNDVSYDMEISHGKSNILIKGD